ncbi:hypothetical protein MKW92_012079 [Papaver armeniacum]|nr:hypothetical protein MKW92_012079 [Papaver armeniacum]
MAKAIKILESEQDLKIIPTFVTIDPERIPLVNSRLTSRVSTTYLLDPNLEIKRCFGLEYTAEQLSEEVLKLTKPVQVKHLKKHPTRR